MKDPVALGIDGLTPIERPARMDIAAVKKRYGNLLSLMGNIDVRYTLPFGTPADVSAEVDTVIQQAAHEGGFILAASDILMNEFPPENVLAMFKAVKQYGQ